MTNGDGGNGKGANGQEMMAQLAETGFFQQFAALEESLRLIADDLKNLGGAAAQRIQETESLAVHMLAVESVLLTVLKQYPVDAESILETARSTTGQPGDDTGNPAVLAVIVDLLKKTT